MTIHLLDEAKGQTLYHLVLYHLARAFPLFFFCSILSRPNIFLFWFILKFLNNLGSDLFNLFCSIHEIKAYNLRVQVLQSEIGD